MQDALEKEFNETYQKFMKDRDVINTRSLYCECDKPNAFESKRWDKPICLSCGGAILRAAPRVKGWLSIESAPVDSVILTYSPASNSNPVIMAVVRVDVDILGGKIFLLEATDCQAGCGDVGTPTHWQPLPQPPKISK